MWRNIPYVAAVLASALCIYAGLRSSPYLQELPFVPEWAGRWLDAHGNTRHFLGWAFVTFLVGWAFLRRKAPKLWPTLLFAVGGLATLLEVAQAFLPQRHADWQDVVWSWAGVAFGAGVFEPIRRKRGRS